MTATLPKLLTAEEFAKLPNPVDGSIDELVRGGIVIVGPARPADPVGFVPMWLAN